MFRRTVSFLVCVLVLSLAIACKEGLRKNTEDAISKSVRKSTPSSHHPQIETARNVVEWLATGEFEHFRQTFDQAMREAFPDDAAVAKWWRGVVVQTGKFRKHFAATRKSKGERARVIVTSVFDYAPQDVLLFFNAKGEIAGIQVSASTNPEVRPQTPRPPFPYSAQEVLYDNPKSGTKIAGTLTVPTGNGPHPGALLISGSGPQDRDNTMFGHKSFLLIADHLSRKGIAVLRVDDRGVGGSTGDPSQETLELIATDVEASLAFLKSQKPIDPKRIGLIGHSVGGIVAPIVASRSADVAFVVSLAGPAASGVEILPVQVRALLESRGQPKDVVADIVAAHEKLAPLIAADAPESKLKPAVAALVKAARRTLPKNASPRVEEAILKQLQKQVLGPWQRSFAKSDPAKYLSQITVPILVMFAEKDVVVPASLNLDRARQALGKAENKSARLEKLPGLNHLFQKAETGAIDEYVLLTDTFDQGALDLMTSWLLETVGLAP
ncbi:MAG: alpha/beta fold hydrolase [Deltaproteobacteria bacterium]|nr:alpha/beta fold hydrolase [Deltaproteobacteria bacterium]